jgi:general secretion pathway protein H
MRRRVSPQAGFTLIELLVVLAVLGLALAVVVPQLDSGGETVALRAGATELRAALRAAHSAAITANRNLLFAIDHDGRGYTLDGIHHGLRASALHVEPAARILFFATGGSSGGRLAIRGRRGEQVLEIDGVTGQVVLAR